MKKADAQPDAGQAIGNHDAAARSGISDYTYAPVCESGAIAYFREERSDGSHTVMIAKPVSEEFAVEAAVQLRNEFALRQHMDASWALKPTGSMFKDGGMVLLYDETDVASLSALSPYAPAISCFLQLAIKIVDVVRAAHARGLAHKNLNPASFFIDDDGAVKIGGFSFASHSASDCGNNTTPSLGGSPAYMSPEHIGRTKRTIDLRSDLYSLGVIFYELLTGHLPFGVSDAKNGVAEWIHFHIASEALAPHLLNKELPEMLSLLVMRLLAKNPDRRYQTAAGLRADLKRCQAAWEDTAGIEIFSLGQHDQSLQLLFSSRLYARDAAMAVSNSNITTACFECCHLVANRLTRNDPLGEVRVEIERALAFVRRATCYDVETILIVQRHFIDALANPAKNTFSGKDVLPGSLIFAGGSAPERLTTLVFWYWLYKAIIHYHAGEYTLAADCIAAADELARSAPAHIHLLDYHLFSALTLAAGDLHSGQKAERRESLLRHHRKIARWAALNPATFADKEALVLGEIARIEGEPLAALGHYEKAISHAGAAGFSHYLGLAHELAARLCGELGHHTAERAHRKAARSAYQHWGAFAMVKNLERRHPQLSGVTAASQSPATLSETAGIKDLESVIRSARALSEEIRLDKLIQTIMSVALEHVGAEKGLLLRMDGNVPYIEACARTTVSGITVDLLHTVPGTADLPIEMLNKAIRTGRHIGMESIQRPYFFNWDPCAPDLQQFSAMCIPMLKQAKVVGVLYLENRLLPDAFTLEHTKILQLLAAQAAISLETARLYAALLAENVQRGLVENALRASQTSLILSEQFSHTGSLRYILKDGLMICSAELCRIYGLEPGQDVLSYDQFSALLHPDDRQMVLGAIEAAIAVGGTIRVEHRILRKDGSVRYISGIGKPLYVDDHFQEYVGTATDITTRRQAEDALRVAQADLARVSRATTVGQLTASIAHEINQPLMSIVSNAGASLRWLDRDPPETGNARAGLRDIVSEGQRAGDMIQSLRALTRNSEPIFERIDLHSAVRHILAISRSELERRSVSLETSLLAEDSHVAGDCVQIQQVLLNLVVNAIEAMAEISYRPRVLSITSRNTDPKNIMIEVEDTGEGIESEKISRIFEAFYTTKKNGMGMGLAICRSIVETHHGQLFATAREPHGSRFSFRLPLVE